MAASSLLILSAYNSNKSCIFVHQRIMVEKSMWHIIVFGACYSLDFTFEMW